MIDTGYAGTGMLEEGSLAQLLAARELRVTGEEHAVSISGISSARVVRLSQLSLGTFEHHDFRFTSSSDNVLGLDYLSRYKVTIDFRKELIYLAKSKSFADRDCGQTCGLRYFFRARVLEISRSPKRALLVPLAFGPKIASSNSMEAVRS